MKVLIHFLFIVLFLFGSCSEKPFVKPTLPDKDLQEIVIYGVYFLPEGKEEEDFRQKS